MSSDRSCYCRFARSGMGNWPEIYPWFYPPDAQRHHYRRNDCQYRHVVMGDAKLASRNGLRCLDGHWRGRGCHYRYSAAGESASTARIASLALIVAGIIGLKLSTH